MKAVGHVYLIEAEFAIFDSKLVNFPESFQALTVTVILILFLQTTAFLWTSI